MSKQWEDARDEQHWTHEGYRQRMTTKQWRDLLLNDDDQVLLTRLSAILRLAESLERGRNVAVDDVIVTWGDDYLRLTLITDEYPAVELWQTERNSLPLVEAAFERPVLLDSVAAPSEWPQSE